MIYLSPRRRGRAIARTKGGHEGRTKAWGLDTCLVRDRRRQGWDPAAFYVVRRVVLSLWLVNVAAIYARLTRLVVLLLAVRNDEGPLAKLAWMPRLVVESPGRRLVVDGELAWYRRWESAKDGIGGKSKRKDGEIIKE